MGELLLQNTVVVTTTIWLRTAMITVLLLLFPTVYWLGFYLTMQSLSLLTSGRVCRKPAAAYLKKVGSQRPEVEKTPPTTTGNTTLWLWTVAAWRGPQINDELGMNRSKSIMFIDVEVNILLPIWCTLITGLRSHAIRDDTTSCA